MSKTFMKEATDPMKKYKKVLAEASKQIADGNKVLKAVAAVGYDKEKVKLLLSNKYDKEQVKLLINHFIDLFGDKNWQKEL